MASAVNANGHTIDVSVNRLTGKEHVTYDGQDVSSKRNLKGTITHEFDAEENGEQAHYEVDTKNEVLGVALSAVRRNGQTVFPA